jgi:hypothetical protein
MQIHHASIYAVPITTEPGFNFSDEGGNDFGSEGVLHLSKGHW